VEPFKGARDRDGAMSIGIGFDHGQDLAGWTDAGSYLGEVMREGAKVDAGEGRRRVGEIMHAVRLQGMKNLNF
jgi:hypothetical protein